MKTIIVTGGAGFIGSNFLRYFLDAHTDINIVNYDKLTYAGNLANLSGLESNPRYSFVRGDICDSEAVGEVFARYNPDYIVNFAAESHVDRSIDGPLLFGHTNVLGTLNLLQCAKEHWSKTGFEGKRFLHISTDEVYGSIDNYEDSFSETSQLMPNSPYSASKASSDLMVRAYYQTYGLPVIITRCSNNYGAYQFKEKFVPTCISKALNNQPIPIYGDGTNVREWIYVEDHCRAVDMALMKGKLGEIYNIGSGVEMSNLTMAKTILEILEKPSSLIVMVADRLGHDKRYAVNSDKAKRELGWACEYGFSEGIRATVEWYIDNQTWWS